MKEDGDKDCLIKHAAFSQFLEEFLNKSRLVMSSKDTAYEAAENSCFA